MTARDAGGITRNGLRVDPTKQRAWQRRGAERYAASRQANRNRARLTTTIGRPRRSGNDWPAATRRLAYKRSAGRCELCATTPATDLHHRKPRRHRDHRVCNALHLCRRCHDRIPTDHAGSVRAGWIVTATLDPAVVPVLIAGAGMVLLTDTGHYEETA